mmetsp:Transcript_12434/g.25276  ORF Transcript_12434/g.25276 Transcript_12434/m.25276 type:complete len:257 (+) Transcript_12434:2-772(+)
MWISMLREFRERRARALDLFGRAIHRKKTMKDWAALVIAAGEKQVQERAENAAASLISLHFFAFCCQKSVLFKRRHPSGPRVKGDERAHKAREEREFKLKELSEEEAKAAHEAFITQAARLRLVGNDAELKLLREREVLKMTPEDMSIRVASLLAHARKYQHKPNAKASGGGGGDGGGEEGGVGGAVLVFAAGDEAVRAAAALGPPTGVPHDQRAPAATRSHACSPLPPAGAFIAAVAAGAAAGAGAAVLLVEPVA